MEKIQRCAPKNVGTCLIWSFPAKMDKWQDVTSLSWAHLMGEIKHKKVMIAHLNSTKICDLVHQQQLWHYCDELLVLEREEERRWMVAFIWKSCLRPHPS